MSMAEVDRLRGIAARHIEDARHWIAQAEAGHPAALVTAKYHQAVAAQAMDDARALLATMKDALKP